MKIAIAGGTGTIGTRVVEAVIDRGHEPVVLARSVGVDVVTGTGLAGALDGVHALIDVVSVAALSARTSRQFFTAATRNLQAAEIPARVAHHVALSIVGVDAAPFSYYAGKVAQENAVRTGPVPWTILRATQFHEFAAQMHARLVRGPVGLIPRMRTQPVAAREVAERLVTLATGEPAGRVADLGGPREERLIDLVRRYARAQGLTERLFEFPMPGPYGTAMRDGTLLTRPGSDLGTHTFDDWLATLPATW